MTHAIESSRLGERFELALQFAHQLHRFQVRKMSGTPYIAHLLAASALVLEDGGSEDEAIAALLHDAAEDQGGLKTLKIIEEKFGSEVSKIVAACSDTFEENKPDWKKRKLQHLEKMRHANSSVLRVTLADKLNNSRAMLRDSQKFNLTFWDSFKGGREGTLWYLAEMHQILAIGHPGDLANELGKVISQLKAIT